MKIYHKRNFFVWDSRIYTLYYCICNHVYNQNHRCKTIVLNVIVFTLGIVNISRSLSKSDTAEDIVEENDERNKLISLRINQYAI